MYNLSIKPLWYFAVLLLLVSPNNAAVLNSDLSKRDQNGFLKIGFDVKREQTDHSQFRTKQVQSFDSVYPEPITYTGGVSYIIDLYAGSDKQKNLITLDTGSADLWFLGAADASPNGHFDPSTSKSSQKLNGTFSIGYADGTGVFGDYYNDTVALGENGPSVSVKFAVINGSTNGNTNGLLGIGYADEEAQVLYNKQEPYVNFPQALKNQGFIKKNAYSLYLNDPSATTGEVIFGGVDHAKYTGNLVEFPTIGQKFRFNIELDSVEFNGTTIQINKPATLDSGFSYASLPPPVIQPILKATFGSGYRKENGGYNKDGPCPDDFELKVNFKGISFTIPNNDLFVEHDGICQFIISESEENTDFTYVLGDNFLRHAYVVYDLDDRKISLAHVKYNTESNISVIS